MENNKELLPSPVILEQEQVSSSKSFIEANTEASSVNELRDGHIIPVFVRDNEPLISHADFVEAANAIAIDVYNGEQILKPQIRVSHPIKGRIPDAKDKPAHLLQDWEKTVFYERMMFVIEIPTIKTMIDGSPLTFTIGGVKAYNSDNLYSRNISEQHFKIFCGFQNKICTNLCVWTDGYMADVKVRNIGQLKAAIRTLIESYNQNYQLYNLNKFTEFSITEHQFAQIIGRARMYQHLHTDIKYGIQPILFGDNQMSSVVKDYYKDESFCRDKNGNINLWRLYNLFTGANKSSYIDSFLDRSVNAYQLVEQICFGLENKSTCWYLN